MRCSSAAPRWFWSIFPLAHPARSSASGTTVTGRAQGWRVSSAQGHGWGSVPAGGPWCQAGEFPGLCGRCGWEFLLTSSCRAAGCVPRASGCLAPGEQPVLWMTSVGSADPAWHHVVLLVLAGLRQLLRAVFSSLDMSRSVSVTAAGQCRLAPLIPVILDCSHLYDYTVKLLFKLHSCECPQQRCLGWGAHTGGTGATTLLFWALHLALHWALLWALHLHHCLFPSHFSGLKGVTVARSFKTHILQDLELWQPPARTSLCPGGHCLEYLDPQRRVAVSGEEPSPHGFAGGVFPDPRRHPLAFLLAASSRSASGYAAGPPGSLPGAVPKVSAQTQGIGALGVLSRL